MLARPATAHSSALGLALLATAWVLAGCAGPQPAAPTPVGPAQVVTPAPMPEPAAAPVSAVPLAAAPVVEARPATFETRPSGTESAGAASATTASAAVAPPAAATSPSGSAQPNRLPPPRPQITQAPVPSQAADPRAYRRDAARHLYGAYRDRIYKGKMPPLLYAVGVLSVDIGPSGQVERLQWMREPSHAPEVVTHIEAMVRAAAPYPVPSRMGRVSYTDVWLWDKSSRFQLDTLTEGQR